MGATGMASESGIGGDTIGDGVASDLDVVDADDRPAVTLIGLSHRIRLHRLIDYELHAHDSEGGLADTFYFARVILLDIGHFLLDQLHQLSARVAIYRDGLQHLAVANGIDAWPRTFSPGYTVESIDAWLYGFLAFCLIDLLAGFVPGIEVTHMAIEVFGELNYNQ